MELVLYMKNLDCPNCAEKIRKETEKIPFVKEADMNFMAKKLSLTIARESSDAVLKEVRRITAVLEPDVEVSPIDGAVYESADSDEDGESSLKGMLIKIVVSAVIFAVGLFSAIRLTASGYFFRRF